MNIFVLDDDIEKSVQYHCDKHVVKMCIEYAQLLCSVHNVTNPDVVVPYKLTHKNHPCAIWARTSIQNYEYLFSLAVLLGEEYTYRYGKFHKSALMVETLPSITLPDIGMTEHAKCVHDDFKIIENPVEAYRAFYNRDKAYFCKWKYRDVPNWFKPQELLS